MKKVFALLTALACCFSLLVLPAAAEGDILDEKFQEVLDVLDHCYIDEGLTKYMVVKTNRTVFEDLYEDPYNHYGETLVLGAAEYEEVLNRNFVPSADDLEKIRTEGYGNYLVYDATANSYTIQYPGGFGGFLSERIYLGYVATSEGFDVFYGKANYCFLSDALPNGITVDQYAGLLNYPATIEYEGKVYGRGPDGYYYLDSIDQTGMKYSLVMDNENVRISGATTFTEEECPESFEKLPEVDEDLLSIMSDIEALVSKYGPEIPDEVKNGTDKGTTGIYEPDGSSYYVAIGDDTAIGENSYVSLLATRYGVTAKNLAAKNMLIDEADAAFLAENNADIVKADLITIGFSVNGFASVAVEEVMKDLSDAESYLQWGKYLPEEGLKEIEAVLARMKKYLEDNGMSGNLMGISKSDALVAAAESIAFGTLAYINELPRLIDDLRTINPTAQIVVVGMDNPMENSSIALGSGEKMELGIYVDQLLKNMDDASQTVVLERENAVFVSATHAANANDNQELTENKLIRSYIGGVRDEAKPNEEGQKYIQNRINLALRQNGDVDGDGKVSYNDALMVLRLSIGLAELNEEESAFGDVDGANGLSYNDALKILRASIGLDELEEETPAEKHDWQPATCTEPKKCKECGVTQGTAKGHDWKNATCSAPKTCNTCGVTEGTTGEHDWQEATCTAPKTCKACGVTEGTTGEHDWQEATCTVPQTCKTCNVTSGSIVDHTYDSTNVCTGCGIERKAFITLPETPVTVSFTDGRGRVLQSVEITRVTTEIYDFNSDKTVDYTISFTGIGTYNYKGNSVSEPMYFGYKLYDSEGFVVKSGNVFTTSIAVGDKFIEEIIIYNLDLDQSYTLFIYDI